MKKIVGKIFWLIQVIFSERLFIYASSISFNIIFILIPTLLLIFSIGSIFLDVRKDMVGQIIGFVREQIPFMEGFVKDNIQILVARGKWLGFAGIVILLWTTSRLFLNFRIVLFDIFSLEEPKYKFLYRLKEVASVGILAVMFLLFFVSNSLTLSLKIAASHFSLAFLTVPLMRESIYLVNAFLMVFFIYITVLGHRVPMKSVLYGSFLSTIFLEIMKLLFKYFLMYAWRGKTIYGSLWVFLAFFIWIYYSVLGFVAGSEIASIKRGHR